MTLEELKNTGRVYLIDKPLTWTSFDVVNKMRYTLCRTYHTKKLKVGHAGTLDPLASGLLIVCAGKETKNIDLYQAREKEYTGTITLGACTPSYDAETEVTSGFPTEHITDQMIHATTKNFIGNIMQRPPVFSALMVDGKRAYQHARSGEQVEMTEREISISEFEITRIQMPEVDFRVVCSKGTYIRSLANDFGEAIGSKAYLSALRRTRIGQFCVSDAMDINAMLEKIANEAEIEQENE
ncbi:MAG: tRNA pseudouridine(55) synthase TruB [Flavobacteriales bacterium]|nr:tRNA pseudouridine(55) synthase TruB [Flavobacteriales bacterium]